MDWKNRVLKTLPWARDEADKTMLLKRLTLPKNLNVGNRDVETLLRIDDSWGMDAEKCSPRLRIDKRESIYEL